ncbi:MAG: M48 family metalloprotease [Candidatus Brocadiia bacterium]
MGAHGATARRAGGRRRALVLALLLVLCLAGCRTSPVTGRAEFMLLTEDDEVALGHSNHPNVVFMYDGEYHDPELNRYLGTLVMRLHECSHRPQMPMEFTMLNTSVLNAFATPAHVYATRGFLARLENEAQFAAVMAHELAHVAAGHSARQLSRNLVISLALGVADYAAGDSVASGLAMGAGKVGVALLGLSYSREQERQADRVGAYYMALAGWDPRQAIAMQKLLNSFREDEPSFLDQYLSTHPMTDNRVEEIQSVIEQMQIASRYVQGDGVYSDRWGSRLERLREVDRAFAPYDEGLKALSEKRFDQALEGANEALGIREDQAQFWRLKGDALLGLGLTDQAREAYRESLERDERYVLANLGLGRAYLAEGNDEAAEREFEKVRHDYPGSVVARHGLGVARFRQGRYAEAAEPLSTVARQTEDPAVWYLLGVSYDRAGDSRAAFQAYQNALNRGLSGQQRDAAQDRLYRLREGVEPRPQEPEQLSPPLRQRSA